MAYRILLALALMTLLTQLVYADKPKTDKQLMQGEWRVTAMRVRATDVDVSELDDGVYVFTNDRLKVAVGDGASVSELTFRPEKTPKELDMKVIEGEGEGKTFFGIYRFDDGKLILCIDETRPTIFSGDGGAGLLVLERIK